MHMTDFFAHVSVRLPQELIKNEQYGFMVALQNEKIVPVPLGEVAGKLEKSPLSTAILSRRQRK